LLRFYQYLWGLAFCIDESFKYIATVLGTAVALRELFESRIEYQLLHLFTRYTCSWLVYKFYILHFTIHVVDFYNYRYIVTGGQLCKSIDIVSITIALGSMLQPLMSH